MLDMLKAAISPPAHIRGLTPARKIGVYALIATAITGVATIRSLFLATGLAAMGFLGLAFVDAMMSGVPLDGNNQFLHAACVIGVLHAIVQALTALGGTLYAKFYQNFHERAVFLALCVAGFLAVSPMVFVPAAAQAAVIASFVPAFAAAGLICLGWIGLHKALLCLDRSQTA